tara:strand:+ start:60 stop:440 length:381 start_codon:yes stop_codon:yes gene_type:complete
MSITKEQIKEICDTLFGYDSEDNPQNENTNIKLSYNNKFKFHCNLIELYTKIKTIGYKKNLFESDYPYDNYEYINKLQERKNIFWPNNNERILKHLFDINFYIPLIHYDDFCKIIADSINNIEKKE